MEDIKRAITVLRNILSAAGKVESKNVFSIKKAETSNKLDTIVDPEYWINPDISFKNIGTNLLRVCTFLIS